VRPRKSINQINVVPYIDVMLVLLVIFMVTAPLITPGEIELPTVGSKPAVPQSPLHVFVDKKGALSLRDERSGTSVKARNRQDLATLIQQKLGARPDQPVVIEADKDVPYGDVVAILDLLKQTSGTGKVGLLVQPPQK
jgi:biopolymer transport protein TolR